jgi:hypothetical protein
LNERLGGPHIQFPKYGEVKIVDCTSYAVIKRCMEMELSDFGSKNMHEFLSPLAHYAIWFLILNVHIGCAIAQVVSHWPLTVATQGVLFGGLWWLKWHWGCLSLNTSVLPTRHSTDCSTLILIWG